MAKKPKLAKPEAPTGTYFGQYQGHPMIIFEKHGVGRPPQFGKNKAHAIVRMDALGVPALDIAYTCVDFGMRGVAHVSPELLVKAAHALVDKLAADAEAEAA